MKRHFFTITLLLYLLHYAFPLVQHWRGYEIEELVWDAVFSRRLAPEQVTTAWALRWLMNGILLGLAWLRVPEVHVWVYSRIDGRFLHQLLVVFIGFLLVGTYTMQPSRWAWGMLYWGLNTALAIWAYIIAAVKPPPPISHGLEAHFVPLEED